ncbi:MAG: hypothetical protein DCF22_23975 [Leptolyngbya sp.]|nr:MAG: hypothetical protein DCF22_23975 [Leptolyngbya sp.]
MLSQMWSKVGKLLGGLSLVGGGTVSAGLLLGIAIAHPSGILLIVLLTLLVFFGLAPAAIGMLLLYSGFKAEHYAIRDRFFQVLRLSQGRMTVLDFAAAARLEPLLARRHLDSWAREFDANFDVSDEGDVYYVFPPQLIALPESRFQAVGQAVREVLRSL